MTVPMVRVAVAELIKTRPPQLEEIAKKIRNQIARNEQARTDRWRAKGLVAPKKRLV